MLRDVREKIESDAETDEAFASWAEKFAADLERMGEVVVETTEGDNEGSD
ncbi:MAG: hypothetical protein ACYTEQ_19720 [Planctomycetota bacterium]|jgi:hypothetical protein